jgi:hypothetical protein
VRSLITYTRNSTVKLYYLNLISFKKLEGEDHKIKIAFEIVLCVNSKTNFLSEGGCLLGWSAMLSGRSLPTFEKYFLSYYGPIMEEPSTSETSVKDAATQKRDILIFTSLTA